MAGGARTPGGTGPGARGTRRIGGGTRHAVLVILVGVAAALVLLGTASGFLAEATRAALDGTNPHRGEYGGLAGLRVGVPPDYVESLLGPADSVAPLCEVAECPADPEGAAVTAVHVYRGENSIVRAVFRDHDLAAYLVTTTSRDFTPRITWLGVDFGRLGRATYAEVLPSNGAPAPSDASAFVGPGIPSYAEVLMGGGASRFQGFLLATASDGYGGPGLAWDEDAARALEAWQFANQGRGFDPDVAREFRTASMPNTFGAFRDDGPLRGYFRDAENVRALLTVSIP